MMNMTIKERINGIAFENLTAEDFEFLKERALKSIRKPSERKGPTKAQKENEGIKATIAETLADAEKAMTATEVGNAVGISCQKASALLKQMVDAGTATKAKEGKATVFTVAE